MSSPLGRLQAKEHGRACCQTQRHLLPSKLGFDYRLCGVCLGLSVTVTVAQAWGPAGPLGGSPPADPQPAFIPLGDHTGAEGAGAGEARGAGTGVLRVSGQRPWWVLRCRASCHPRDSSAPLCPALRVGSLGVFPRSMRSSAPCSGSACVRGLQVGSGSPHATRHPIRTGAF